MCIGPGCEGWQDPFPITAMTRGGKLFRCRPLHLIVDNCLRQLATLHPGTGEFVSRNIQKFDSCLRRQKSDRPYQKTLSVPNFSVNQANFSGELRSVYPESTERVPGALTITNGQAVRVVFRCETFQERCHRKHRRIVARRYILNSQKEWRSLHDRFGMSAHESPKRNVPAGGTEKGTPSAVRRSMAVVRL
jgi:hypothetical protein